MSIDINDYESMADALYDIYKQSSHGSYMVERIKGRFYGNLVKDHIPDFNELYAILKAGNHGPKNPLVTGDMDEGSWIEKSDNEYSKIIAIERYCSCAIDNTHIFILNEFKYEPPEGEGFSHLEQELMRFKDWTTFTCVTAWPRQISKRHGHKWGDHRDIEHPSIHTFRKHNFRFAYEDGRDDHYCFKYDSLQGRVEDAYWKEGRLNWALSSLRDGLGSVKIEAECNE
jgi:hypothetical protein